MALGRCYRSLRLLRHRLEMDTGWKWTLGMSIAEMLRGGATGGVGRVRLMEGEREACLIYSL